MGFKPEISDIFLEKKSSKRIRTVERRKKKEDILAVLEYLIRSLNWETIVVKFFGSTEIK